MMDRVRSHATGLTQAGMVVFLFAYLVGIAALFALKNPLYGMLLAGAPFALFGLLWIQSHLELAPAAILVVAAFIPLGLSTGTGSRLVFSLILTLVLIGVWVLRMLSVEHRLALRAMPLNRPLIVFIVVTGISLVWSILFRDPTIIVAGNFILVQGAAAVVMITLPAVFLLMSNWVNGLAPLKVMVGIMLGAGILGAIKMYTSLPLPVDTNGLFSMWVIVLATSLALFQKNLTWTVRLLLFGLAGAWVYWGFGLHIDWLAGWLPGFIALGVVSLVRSKRLFLVLVLLLVVYSVFNYSHLMDALSSEDQVSGGTRLAAWQMNWQVTSQHLLLGTGPAGYAAYYMSYFPDQAMATHNNYIDVVSQTGLVGMAAYLWIFASLVWLGVRVLRRVRGRRDFVESLGVAAFAGTIACIVIMAFGDWLLPFAYTQTIAGYDYAVYNWLFMGFVLVLDQVTRPGGQ
jgi:O-antigen ligase